MAASMLQKGLRQVARHVLKNDTSVQVQSARTTFYRKHRGKPIELARSWQQRMDELQTTESPRNIGFAMLTAPKKWKLKKSDPRTEPVSEDEIVNENFSSTEATHLQTIAHHYGVYEHLFGHAYFSPQMKLDVYYDTEDHEYVNPVYCGNIIPPAQVSVAPHVVYESYEDRTYTLCMVAPDSHLQDNSQEYIQWMLGNIPGSDIDQGEVIYDYLTPFPVKGTGYHRYVFVLYEHKEKIDYTEIQRPPNCTSLRQRAFSTLEFYRKHQENITPVALAFFQSAWDDSVTDTFWNTLDMKEPCYEFIHPPPYRRPQEKWPIRRPFHMYMDEYRDVKDLNEEVLLEKLKTADPFSPRPPRPRYPNLQPIDKEKEPSWRQLKITEQRLRKHHWKDLDD